MIWGFLKHRFSSGGGAGVGGGGSNRTIAKDITITYKLNRKISISKSEKCHYSPLSYEVYLQNS